VRAGYGAEKYAKLVALKDKWDPDNLFPACCTKPWAWLPGLCRAGLEPEPGWQQPRIPWSRNGCGNDQATVAEDPAANH
jgi:Berberine and berberine like